MLRLRFSLACSRPLLGPAFFWLPQNRNVRPLMPEPLCLAPTFSPEMDELQLEDLLSTPRSATVAALAACPGDVIVLGAGGKMGPSLARMVARAVSDGRRVYAVSRW